MGAQAGGVGQRARLQMRHTILVCVGMSYTVSLCDRPRAGRLILRWPPPESHHHVRRAWAYAVLLLRVLFRCLLAWMAARPRRRVLLSRRHLLCRCTALTIFLHDAHLNLAARLYDLHHMLGRRRGGVVVVTGASPGRGSQDVPRLHGTGSACGGALRVALAQDARRTSLRGVGEACASGAAVIRLVMQLIGSLLWNALRPDAADRAARRQSNAPGGRFEAHTP